MSICNLCDDGYPIKNGRHIPIQSKGMIPETPCKFTELAKLLAWHCERGGWVRVEQVLRDELK